MARATSGIRNRSRDNAALSSAHDMCTDTSNHTARRDDRASEYRHQIISLNQWTVNTIFGRRSSGSHRSREHVANMRQRRRRANSRRQFAELCRRGRPDADWRQTPPRATLHNGNRCRHKQVRRRAPRAATISPSPHVTCSGAPSPPRGPTSGDACAWSTPNLPLQRLYQRNRYHHITFLIVGRLFVGQSWPSIHQYHEED